MVWTYTVFQEKVVITIYHFLSSIKSAKRQFFSIY